MVGEGLYLIHPEKPDSVAQGCVTFHSAANTGQQHWVKLRCVPRAGGVTRLLSTTDIWRRSSSAYHFRQHLKMTLSLGHPVNASILSPHLNRSLHRILLSSRNVITYNSLASTSIYVIISQLALPSYHPFTFNHKTHRGCFHQYVLSEPIRFRCT